MDSGMAADNDLDLDLLRWIADESVADDHWVLVDLLSQEEIEDLIENSLALGNQLVEKIEDFKMKS